MIDIIIPAYNAHNTIRETLNSIKKQNKIEKINVYILNDASDENYQKIIEEYTPYIKIKEIEIEKNSGPGVARQIRNRKNQKRIYNIYGRRRCTIR